MVASRFAGQRLLAEGPRVLLEGDLLDLAYGLDDEAISAPLRPGKGVALPVGPEMSDAAGDVRQLVLSASLAHPMAASAPAHEGQVTLLRALESAANLGPRPVMSTSFGWATPGDWGLEYRTPAGIDVRGVNYEQEIRRAFLEAVEQLQLQPGDLVQNKPLRTKWGAQGGRQHLGRELFYMKHGGFGPMDQGRYQHGRVSGSGSIEPELLRPADDVIMARMGWKAGPLTEASGAAIEQLRPGPLERGRSRLERVRFLEEYERSHPDEIPF